MLGQEAAQLLVLRHTADNDLGHLAPILDALGLRYRYIHAFDPVYETPGCFEAEVTPDTRGLIILGGPQNVDELNQYPFLAHERSFIARWVLEDRPTFGICLGGQLIARSLGAVVSRHVYPEIGWTPILLSEAGECDPVMAALGNETPQVQWHNDAFDLPDGAILLASTLGCPNQAYRLGQHVYGFQFHPEADFQTISNWINSSQSLPEAHHDQFLLDTRLLYPTGRQYGQRLFERFCHLHLLD